MNFCKLHIGISGHEEVNLFSDFPKRVHIFYDSAVPKYTYNQLFLSVHVIFIHVKIVYTSEIFLTKLQVVRHCRKKDEKFTIKV